MTYAEWIEAGPAPYTGLRGRLDTATLCRLPWQLDVLLRCDAASDLGRLNAAYVQQFGRPLVIESGYRTYARQAQLRAQLGTIAAVPGTSNHGWGRAVDTGDASNPGFGSVAYLWLQNNAKNVGWSSPSWALQTGGLPEY